MEIILARPPRRILIVVTRRIGDVLLTTPLVRSLKRHWPNARIDALVFRGTESVLANNPDLASVIAVPSKPTIRESFGLVRDLWNAYDLSVSALTSDKATLYAWIAGRRSIGLLNADAKSAWKRRLLDNWVRFDDVATHTVTMNLKLAELIGAPPVPLVVPPSGGEEGLRKKARGLITGKYAVLHPVPMYPYKAWTDAGWRQLASALGARGLQVVVSGGGRTDELEQINRLVKGFPAGALNLAGRLQFNELRALIAASAVYIGPDTVVTHLAAATGVPTISLFGPSNPVKWGPWPAQPAGPAPYSLVGTQRVGNVVLLQGLSHCVPCMQEGCQRHLGSLSLCLQTIPVARILAALEAMRAA